MGTNYTHRLYIDNDERYHLSWKFDDKDIEFEVIVNTTGYVGFGFFRDGTLQNFDVVIGEMKNDEYSLEDYHGFANGTLVKDAVQNWILVSAEQANNQTKMVFKRQLITNDVNDMDITEDTMRVMWAYGNKDFNKNNFTVGGYKSLYMLQIKRPDTAIPENATIVMVAVNQTLIPKDDTTYWCKRIQVPAFKEKMQVIRISPFVTKGNELFVHHILLYYCKTTKPVTEGEKGHRCYAENMPDYWDTCRSLIFAWAIGGSSFPLPAHVGLPLDESAAENIFVLEIHYDNPEEKTGFRDSSGFEIVLVPATREYDAGILEIGQIVSVDGFPLVQPIPPYQTTFRYQGVCRSKCVYETFPPKDQNTVIKMFATFLHGHLLARQILLQHYRNDQLIATISADRNYDFNYQEMIFLSKEIEFRPGDDLKVQCVYNSQSLKKLTWGGLTTTDEMCLVYIMYYPKVNAVSCVSGIAVKDKTWLDNSIESMNIIKFQQQNVSEEFEKNLNGLGKDSTFVTFCANGTKQIQENQNSVKLLKILEFSQPQTTNSPITTTDASKAGISALNMLNLSVRSAFLGGVLLYLMI